MYLNNKILIVGDLRPALNYGAIATSEQLITFIQNHASDSSINIIDQRSYFAETPANGWDNDSDSYRNSLINKIKEENNSTTNRIVQKLRSFPMYYFMRNIWRAISKEKINGDDRDLPDTIEEMQLHSKLLIEGKRYQYEKRMIEKSDVVIINAEGSIVHGKSQDGKYKVDARYVLFMAYLAKIVFNKKCYIVNHCVDPDSVAALENIKYLYPKMDGIFVREKFSYKKLVDNAVSENVKVVPDALFMLDTNQIEIEPLEDNIGIDFTKPYICVGDTSGFDTSLKMIAWNICETYKELIKKIKKICPQVIFVDGFMGWNSDVEKLIAEENLPRLNLCNCSYKQLFYVLKNSELFLSGRWHASILALLSGTPILLWGADSFKTRALYDLYDYKYKFINIKTIPDNIDAICKEIELVLKDNPR
jgi:hypothetical protein